MKLNPFRDDVECMFKPHGLVPEVVDIVI